MIIYSKELKKEFDTVEECQAAEAEYAIEQEKLAEEKRILKEERTARAHEIEEAFKEIKVAQDKYNELLQAFFDDYGSYHVSYKSSKDVPDIFELFKPFWCI